MRVAYAEEPVLDRSRSTSEAAGDRSESQAEPVLALLHARAGVAGAPLAIRSPEAVIGTDPASDVVLTGPQVARRHAQFRLRAGLWTLVDFGSPGGSIVDGDQVRGEAVLAPGSTVRLGECLFAFAPHDRWQDSPAERRTGDRAPLLVIPARPRSLWPWLFTVVVGCAVILLVFLLLRSS